MRSIWLIGTEKTRLVFTNAASRSRKVGQVTSRSSLKTGLSETTTSRIAPLGELSAKATSREVRSAIELGSLRLCIL
jgi:hypothetical protein